MTTSTHPGAEAARAQRGREEATQVALETVAEGGPLAGVLEFLCRTMEEESVDRVIACIHPLNEDASMLMNLMLNAIEAMTNIGGELTVTSSLSEDRELLIAVRDTGVELPVENHDQIFESFVTTKPHGTGMGLAITRSIVESHGGRLWAIGNPGPGATFLFTLPTDAGEQRPSQQS